MEGGWGHGDQQAVPFNRFPCACPATFKDVLIMPAGLSSVLLRRANARNPSNLTTGYTDFTDKEQILKNSKNLLGLPISVSIRVIRGKKSLLMFSCF